MDLTQILEILVQIYEYIVAIVGDLDLSAITDVISGLLG